MESIKQERVSARRHHGTEVQLFLAQVFKVFVVVFVALVGGGRRQKGEKEAEETAEEGKETSE